MLEFRMLGPFEVRDPAGQPLVQSRRKQRALLALLLVRPGVVVGVDEIVDALWGERPPASARANLHSYVSSLRTLLSRATPAHEPRPRLVANGYRLDLRPDECDATVFESLVDEARRALAADQPDQAAETLARALGLWRGGALEGLEPYGWLGPYAARLEEARLGAIEDQYEARLRLGQHVGLVAELAGATAQHPLRERLWGQYMRALHRAGRRTEALQVYNEIGERLEAEYGVQPGPLLRRLHRDIRTDHRPSPAPPPAAAPTNAAPPVILPPDIHDFTGRAGHVATLVASLRGCRDPVRGEPPTALPVAGIAGMAGVGKTSLALHVAHRLAAEFPDGQLHIDLLGAGPSPLDPSDVLGRLVRALGVDGRAVPGDIAERTALYRSRLARRRMLIVLDNAASEEQVRPLLPGAATCAVLITSRPRLAGVEGARWIDLDVLPHDEAVQLLARVVADQRVAHQTDEAAELVRLCGGLPLAVRIAGARLTARPAWRLGHLVTMLADRRRRLDQLAIGDLEVRTSLALSLDGLDHTARLVFRRLGLFDVPDFTATLAAAVLDSGADEAVAAIESLVDAQLLGSAGSDCAGQLRYRLHDLVRLFARERAEMEDSPEQRTAALSRGFGGMLAITEQMAERIPGPCYARIPGDAPRQPNPWADELLRTDPLLWFDAERGTLLSAVRQAADAGLDELAFDLAACLEKYLDIRGMYVEWEATSAHAMAACRRTGNLRGEAVLLRGLLDIRTWIRSDPSGEAMTRSYETAARLLEMFLRLDEPGGIADAAVFCSWALTAQGRYAEAVDLATWALRLAAVSEHQGGLARAHVAIAVALGEQGRLECALTHLTSALDAARALGNPRYEATALQFLGIAHCELGDSEAGQRRLEESLAFSRLYQDDYTEVLSRLALARLWAREGDPRARHEAETALAIGREHRMNHHVADSLAVLGEIELADGRFEQAVERLEESVAIWRTRGWLSFQAAALTTLGRAYAPIDARASADALSEARALYCRLGLTAKVDEVDQMLTRVEQQGPGMPRPFRQAG